MRLTIRDAFKFSDFSIIIVLEILRQRCFHLFRDFFFADVNVFEKTTTSNHFVENTNHMSFLMHEKIKRKDVTSHELSTNMNVFSRQQFFYQELHVAMLRYNHTNWNMKTQFLYWFDQMSFLNSWIVNFFFQSISLFVLTINIKLHSASRTRFFLRKNQYVQLKQSVIVRVEWILIHEFKRNEKKRIFFMRFTVNDEKERKKLFDLSILRQSKKFHIWTLLDLLSKKSWMISLNQKNENDLEKKLLYCDWNVQFS